MNSQDNRETGTEEGAMGDSTALETGAPAEGERLLFGTEVAAMFRVNPKTVTRWVKAGRLTLVRTPGGGRRYREAEVRAAIDGTDTALDEG
jgi:excisionase family DNA binding protein